MSTCLTVLLDEDHYDIILLMTGVLSCIATWDTETSKIFALFVLTTVLSESSTTPVLMTVLSFTAPNARYFSKSMACYKRHLKP